jgi:hypothetical protein
VVPPAPVRYRGEALERGLDVVARRRLLEPADAAVAIGDLARLGPACRAGSLPSYRRRRGGSGELAGYLRPGDGLAGRQVASQNRSPGTAAAPQDGQTKVTGAGAGAEVVEEAVEALVIGG